MQVKLYAPEPKQAALPAGLGTNDDLKVLRPAVPGARLLGSRLEWTVQLKPLEERELLLKYGVEFPPADALAEPA